ncbi:MAG TPA: FdtA/QdtA family cupin domain-containing protein [Longimicrobiaceae bacterium]|jgi:dTDP-4-dehydrorhamnose 3,5-epimerase-like enzyme
MSLDEVHLIDLPKITDRRGNLSFVEGERHVPFPVRRVYYLYDVPAGESRGGHAHRELQQLLIAAAGSFDVVVNDGASEKSVTLNRPYQGLLIPRLVWRELVNFSSGSVCLVLASQPYDESDYYRDFEEFRKAVAK